MNTLSWFIYLTHVVPVLSNWAIALGLIAAFASIVSFICFIASRDLTDESDREFNILSRKMVKIFFPLFLGGVVMSSLLPDKKTMYMIAASEAGQEVLDTKEAKEIYNDIRLVLKSYTRED